MYVVYRGYSVRVYDNNEDETAENEKGTETTSSHQYSLSTTHGIRLFGSL